MTQRSAVRCSTLRAALYDATGRRLRTLGVGVLVFLTLMGILGFFTAIWLSMRLDNLSAEAVALILLAALAGIAAIVRATPALLHAVANILQARRPDTAGLIPQPGDSHDHQDHRVA